MDGYIKNKAEKIKSLRMAIFWRLFVSFPLVLLLLALLFGLCIMPQPSTWCERDVVFDHFSYEHIGIRRWKEDILNTDDGLAFVISPKLISSEELKQQLLTGETYRITYSSTFGVKDLRAISSDSEVFVERALAEENYYTARDRILIFMLVLTVAEICVLILIDRLWSKNDHSMIRKLKQDIRRRQERRNIGG